MPITAPNTPGVKINEVLLVAPPIIGAGTSTAAFVGTAPSQTFQITISKSVAGSTTIPIDALAFGLAASAVLNKVSGASASPGSITLAATAVAAGTKSITATGAVTLAAGDVYSATGLKNQPKLLTSSDQFLQEYAAGVTQSTPLSRAVLGFFANGGNLCYVVDVGAGAATSDVVTGIELLEALDDVRIIAAPGHTEDPVYDALIDQAERLGDRFAILDPPSRADVSPGGNFDPSLLLKTTAASGKRPKDSKYAAWYYPRITVGPDLTKPGDPANSDPDTEAVTNVGHIAGAYASVDENRGVFKAPANVTLRNVLGVEHLLTDADQNAVNTEGVNILRVFSGNVTIWGARTLQLSATADTLFLYVSTRRLVNFVETSLQTGLRFAVFEPNNLVLQQQITRSVRDFLNRIWADGALFGATANDAYYVRFPPPLNTDADRAAGKLTVEIGLRVTFPAEFVIIRIGVILNSPISS